MVEPDKQSLQVIVCLKKERRLPLRNRLVIIILKEVYYLYYFTL